VQTGGVGFEPEIGAILLPLVLRLLETMQPLSESTDTIEVSVTAAREGLEARLRIEGPIELDPESLQLLENAPRGPGRLRSRHDTKGVGTTLRIQFPMARSLRSFLIVEAGGQRIGLPWSAVERIFASDSDPAWTAPRCRVRSTRWPSLFARTTDDSAETEPGRKKGARGIRSRCSARAAASRW